MLHKREGYWEPRKEPTWVRFLVRIDDQEHVRHGVPGVRYDGGINHGNGGIVVTLGHFPGPYHRLELAPVDAMELIELLAAALGDAHGVALPSIDVTAEPCPWSCGSEAVR
ncbi:hypothetical protein [Nocardia asteroides]|uniref:hypothetical protein n=1 Tax=Nocardia asteroides TaxID=1824 RepID=UPI00364C08E9